MEITPATQSFSEFFSVKPTLSIPRFQREYSWEEKHYKQYLDDLYRCLSIEGGSIKTSSYFLGYMLFVPEGSDGDELSLSVVDGQQRLTTITIMLSALARVFHEQGMDPQAKRIFDSYILPRDDDDNARKIIVTKTSYPYFSELIQHRDVALGKIPESDQRKATSEEEEVIRDTYNFFLGAFEESRIRKELSKFLDDKELAAIEYGDILKAVRKQALDTQFVSITVKGQGEGYRLFESLNSKGKPLTNVEMIKNSLFEVLDDKEPSDDAVCKWNDMCNNLSLVGESLTDFYPVFWRSRYSDKSEKKLYDEFRATIDSDADSYRAFLRELVKASSLFKQVVKPDLSYFDNRLQYKRFVRSIKCIETDLGVSQARVVILALLEAHEKRILKRADLEKVGLMLEDFLFAYSSVASLRANSYRGKFSSFARSLHGCSDRNAALVAIGELEEGLKGLYPSRDQFIEGYQRLRRSSKTDSAAENLKARYALHRLDAFYSEGKYELSEPTVEHIAPDAGTGPSVSIGNLILIEGDINGSIGDASFADKLKGYAKSKSAWVKAFIEKNGQKADWTDSDIQERAVSLAEITFDKVLTSF